MASYLVLDALIGNTDRHHENWGLRVNGSDAQDRLSLAPSFDHASSLGRELLDDRRRQMLDAGRVGHYVTQGRGGVFRDSEQRHGDNPLRLVQVASRAYPGCFRPTLERVAALSEGTVRQTFDAIPALRATDVARTFAEQVVLFSKAALIETLR